MPESIQDKIKKMLAADVEPVLTDDEIDDLLSSSGVADSGGNAPVDIGWTPTYDLNAAVAAGWMIKAARAAATVEVDPPGSGVFTSKVFDNCRAMARIYQAKSKLSVNIR
jgi:hypothetical protein